MVGEQANTPRQVRYVIPFGMTQTRHESMSTRFLIGSDAPESPAYTNEVAPASRAIRASLCARTRLPMTRRIDIWGLATLGVLFFAAYLLFANLDHSHLWEDEGSTAVFARTLLETGDIRGWDGRNLIGCVEVRCLNSDGRTVLPPVMFLLTAVGIAVAGDNEVGWRIAHAFCGFLALILLWKLCRLATPGASRLHFILVALVALSPQMLMFFRASRYYAFSTLCFLATIYAYLKWRNSRKNAWLIALGAALIIGFLNHYAIGASVAMSMVACHLFFHLRETSREDFLRCLLTAGCVMGTCFAYVSWIGIIGEDRWGMSEFSTHSNESPELFYRAFAAFRTIIEAGWISWWILPCFVGLAWREIRKGRVSTPCIQTIWFLLLAHLAILVSVFVETLLVQLPAYSVGSQLRYIAFSIPLLFFAKAFFLDRLWTISRTSSCILFAALLLTSIGSFPLKVGPHPAFRSDLIEFVREIHRPYVDGLRLVEEYLSSHAETGDLVHVKFAPMLNEPLVASLGDRFRFCCVVPEAGARHVRQSVRDEWGDHVWEDTRADWIVSSKPLPPDLLPAGFVLDANLDGWIQFPNPQRPEIYWHFWEPPQSVNSTTIYRRMASD